MNRDEEPGIGGAGLAADRDDLGPYRRGRAPAKRKGAARDAGRPAARGGGQGLVLLLVLLLGVGGGAWAWRAQQAQDAMHRQLLAELESARARIVVLEGEVTETGASLTEAGSETEKQINFLDREIRKLWDVANKRNKEWIRENQVANEAVRKDLADADRKIAAVSADLGKLRDRSGSEADAVKKLRADVAALRKEWEAEQSRGGDRELALQTRIDQFSAQLSRVSGGLRGIEARVAELARLDAEMASLREGLAENDRAVGSIDAFRRQTVGSITSLQSAVNQLQKEMEEMRRVY